MLIKKLDPAKFSQAYGISCQGIYPWPGEAATPFATVWCIVKPGEVARAHKHQEHESFCVVKGYGLMTVDDESREVEPGDVILMNPWSTHELKNLSADQDLVFLDLCWEDMAEAAKLNEEAIRHTGTAGARRVLVTVTPATPNGDFHVGHIAGPYLNADIYTRYLKMRGIEAYYLTGADDHQSYVVTKGRKTGATPREVADRFGDVMPVTLKRAGIELDHFALPKSSPYHRKQVLELFKKLYGQGALVAKEVSTLYCESCELFLFEAHVEGECPHCGEDSGGNACETCSRPNDCVDLGNPRCTHCGEKPAVRRMSRLYFPLAPYRERLEEFYARVHMNAHMRALCARMIVEGLPDIAVSHQADWGIPVPVPGFENQRIYVWFEMAPGYLAATQEMLDQRGKDLSWKDCWSGEEQQIVQFFGFDNGYFHAVLFPAIFLAYDRKIRLPAALVTNELYRYEGSKFSTSRNHGMWARELLDRVPVNVARFCLAYDCPETEQNNFSLEGLEQTAHRELIEGWEPWLRELGAKLTEDFDGVVPGTGAWTADQQRFFQDLRRLLGETAAAYEAETFSPQRATRALCELVRTARRFGKAEEHWRAVPERYEERRTAVALEVLAAKTLARLAAPVMPVFGERLWRDLGFEDSLLKSGWEEVPELVPGGRKVGNLDRSYFGK